jgi:hypothetical protein
MPAQIQSIQGATVRLTVEVTLSGSMLAMEEAIQHALNEAGMLASAQALQRIDTDGTPMVVGGVRWTTKGQQPKAYQTPYGEVSIARPV